VSDLIGFDTSDGIEGKAKESVLRRELTDASKFESVRA